MSTEPLMSDLLHETEFLEKQALLQKEIDKYTKNEGKINEKLKKMLSDEEQIFSKLQNIEKVFPNLKILEDESKNLVSSINSISQSSENVCKKIRKLDLARNRVTECQKRVSDLIDLELCAQGVQKAIEDEDYEKGAGHVHRFLSMDQSLLEQTANDVCKSANNVAKAVETLQNASRQLQAIVKHKFDEAVKKDDGASIDRFFKIFPLLGMHEEGLNKFSTFLCAKLQETSQKNLESLLKTPVTDKRHKIIFADILTLLFEGVARLIEIHQPLIETYYGPGKLLICVTIIQKECDRQSQKIIAEFTKIRQITKKMKFIEESQRSLGVNTLNKNEKLDAKDLDSLIGEVTIMHSRIELYLRFLKRRINNDMATANLTPSFPTCQVSSIAHNLLNIYLQLEHYYLTESIQKAIAMDTITETNQNYTSSLPGDMFFLIRKCLRRSITTGCLEGACVMINHAYAALEEFCSVLKLRLRNGYSTGYLDLTQAYNSVIQGRLQTNTDLEQNRILFIVALNNAEISTEYLETLTSSLRQEVTSSFPPLTENELAKFESCLANLSGVSATLKTVIDYGMQQLAVSVIKPRINSWVDGFSSLKHEFTEDELASYEAGESFVQSLIVNIDGLLNSFKSQLTSANYDTLVSILTTEVTSRLEKVILKSSFNRLGGLILDKEIRALSSYLTSAATTWSVRDKFTRLTQLATVLNLERVSEIQDYYSDVITWRLTPAEIRQIMALRTDFKVEDIRRIKL